MIPDTPEQLHLKEASELQSNVSGTNAGEVGVGEGSTNTPPSPVLGFQVSPRKWLLHKEDIIKVGDNITYKWAMN